MEKNYLLDFTRLTLQGMERQQGHLFRFEPILIVTDILHVVHTAQISVN